MSTQRTGGREVFRQTVRDRARDMRAHLTTPELILWNKLREDQLLGLRFRRQHRIGSYIADFYCASAKLVVEVDGDSHDERAEYDAKRTYWLSQRGLRVIRFTNDEVLKHVESVWQSIADHCTDVARLSPPPSPRITGEREKRAGLIDASTARGSTPTPSPSCRAATQKRASLIDAATARTNTPTPSPRCGNASEKGANVNDASTAHTNSPAPSPRYAGERVGERGESRGSVQERWPSKDHRQSVNASGCRDPGPTPGKHP